MNVIKKIMGFLSLRKEEKYAPDKLVNEPTESQILKMSLDEQSLFVRMARMESDCKPDYERIRAGVRACYLINEAYKNQEEKS